MEQEIKLADRLRRYSEPFILSLIALFLFALALLSPVSYAAGDGHFSLIVSQSIWENGTLHLDSYYQEAPDLFDAFDYQVDQQNGHWLYNYPSGSSIFALPWVGLALLSGSDMLVVADNHLWQNIISALVVAAVFLAIYRITRAYLDPYPSLVITLVTMMGSTLISTLSTAFWNLGFAVLFVSLSLGLVAWFDAGRSKTVHPFLLGFVLFAAFLTRPSTSLFILIILVYLAIRDRGSLIRTGVISFGLLLLFLFFSQKTYGSWLPDYYSTGTWFDPAGFFQALYGVFLSPSRGLLIYSPFLLLIITGLLFYTLRGKKRLLFWLCALWIGLHILSVAATRMWWGGYSYGPRLVTDALPGVALMSAILWRDLAPQISKRQQKVVILLYFTLGFIAVFINSYTGLFNIKNALWNAYPSIDQNTEYLFDWTYPQFLVTSRTFHERREDHYLRLLQRNPELLEPYEIGQRLSFDDDPRQAIFSGWWPSDDTLDWTETEEATILFVPEKGVDEAISLIITAGAFGEQPVDLYLNSSYVGQLLFTGEAGQYEIELKGAELLEGQVNELQLILPEARNPSLEELTSLGIRFAPHRLGLSDVTIQFDDESSR